jgi:hypothetical protein
VEIAGAAALESGMILPFELPRWVEGLIDEFADDDSEFCRHPRESEDKENTWTLFGRVNCTGSVHQLFGGWLLETTRETVEETGAQRLDVVHLYSLWGEVLATGETVEAGGALQLTVETAGDTLTLDLHYGGHYVNPAWDGLIARPVSAIVIGSGTFDRSSGFSGTLEGSVEGEGEQVQLDGITFTAGCAAPSGTLRVRDPSAGWWAVTLVDDCRGCGPLDWEGEVVGESCLGLTLANVVAARFGAALDDPP